MHEIRETSYVDILVSRVDLAAVYQKISISTPFKSMAGSIDHIGVAVGVVEPISNTINCVQDLLIKNC